MTRRDLKPTVWSDDDLDAASELSEGDLRDAAAHYRSHVRPDLRDLIDATSFEIEVDPEEEAA